MWVTPTHSAARMESLELRNEKVVHFFNKEKYNITSVNHFSWCFLTPARENNYNLAMFYIWKHSLYNGNYWVTLIEGIVPGFA